MKAAGRAATAAVAAGLLFSHTGVWAAGFALVENSAQGQGNAFSGGGAAATDASTVWFNPASMTALPAGTVFQATGHIIAPSFEYTDRGSRQKAGAGTIALLPGARTNDDSGVTAAVPNLYYKRDLTDDLKFGLSVNTPFGLATKYEGDWIGRYQAVESNIISFNVNPSLGYRVNDMLSLGAGVSVMYMDAKLTNAIDFDAVCLGGAAPAACATAVPGTGTHDGFVENRADGFGYGFNLGAMLSFNKDTRFSVAYRSQVQQTLDGKAKFNVPAGISAVAAVQAGIAAAFADDGITAKLKLPASISFSGFHQINDRWAVMGDATWTQWSSIPELRIVFDKSTTAGGPGVDTLKWKDSWRLAGGASYKVNSRWTVRAGVAYDETPIPSATSRTARLPDNDRIWTSLGATYRYSDNLSVDVGYTHLFIRDTPIARTGSTGSVLIGTYESDANLFSGQLRYSW